MKLNPALPLSDRLQARLAAQAIIRNKFNLSAAAAELRPDLKAPAAWASRLLDEPAVVHEIDRILNRTERNATRFKDSMWDSVELYNSYLAKGEDPPKHVVEVAQTAMRLLGRAYFDPKLKPAAEESQPFLIANVDLDKLTDKKVQ